MDAQRTMTVPVPMETVGPSAPPPCAVAFKCPACGRKFSTKPEMAGKKIRCNGCGAGVRVPQSSIRNPLANPRDPQTTSYSRERRRRCPGEAGRRLPAPRVDVRAASEDEAIEPAPAARRALGWIKDSEAPHTLPKSVLPPRPAELLAQVRQKTADERPLPSKTQTKIAKANKTQEEKGWLSYFDSEGDLATRGWRGCWSPCSPSWHGATPRSGFPWGTLVRDRFHRLPLGFGLTTAACRRGRRFETAFVPVLSAVSMVVCDDALARNERFLRIFRRRALSSCRSEEPSSKRLPRREEGGKPPNEPSRRCNAAARLKLHRPPSMT